MIYVRVHRNLELIASPLDLINLLVRLKLSDHCQTTLGYQDASKSIVNCYSYQRVQDNKRYGDKKRNAKGDEGNRNLMNRKLKKIFPITGSNC